MGLDTKTPWDDMQRRVRNLERAFMGLSAVCDEYMPPEGKHAIQKFMAEFMYSTGAPPGDFKPPFEPPD